MKNILPSYEEISGQAIYFIKSNIVFSPNTTVENKELACNILEVWEVNKPSDYLGLPRHIGRKKIME